MPGLVPEADAESASTTGGNQAFSTSAANTGVPSESVESHLDSFFEENSWTREDVMLIIALFQFSVLLITVAGVYDA
jgi:hypothetical protein